MNAVFIAIIIGAVGFAAWQELFGPPALDPSPMAALSQAVVESAGGAVELAIGLVGVMALFLGLMKVAEAGGMLTIIARLIRPLLVRLFPEVPPDHPAMGAMVLNIAANILGLGNAATPFGIRAMQALDTLNCQRGTATNAMALFLAINTSSVTLLPTGVIALRAAAGSADPAAILPTTLLATIGSTAVAIMAAKVYQRFAPVKKAPAAPKPSAIVTPDDDTSAEIDRDNSATAYPAWVSVLALVMMAGMIPLAVLYGRVLSTWILPALIVFFLLFGLLRGVRVYEVFVEGAKEGFKVALRIFPYLVAILVAVGMLRASGGLEVVTAVLGSVTGRIGLPADALPMALLRPLSGSGAYGVLAATINDPAIGPDSYTGYLVSTLQGSTETTFYVLAVYFGSVQVRRIRHTLAAALTADLAGVIFAILACTWLLR